MAEIRGVRLEAPPDLAAEQASADLQLVAANPALLNFLGPESERHFAVHARRVASVHEDVARHKKDRVAQADAVAPDRGIRAMLTPGVDSATEQYRRERVAASEESRREALKELHRLEALARSLERLHASPRAVATRHALGSESRARFAQSFRGMGSAALETVMHDVLARGDKVGAAALIEVIEAMPTAQRPRGVDTAGIAERVFGAEHRAAQAQIAVAKNRYASALEAERQLVSGRKNGVAKITDGLARRKEQQ